MMNVQNTLFIAPALLLLSYAPAAQACTNFAIQDKQGDIYGRTLEYMQDLPLVVNVQSGGNTV